jgi:hypothetical protein
LSECHANFHLKNIIGLQDCTPFCHLKRPAIRPQRMPFASHAWVFARKPDSLQL